MGAATAATAAPLAGAATAAPLAGEGVSQGSKDCTTVLGVVLSPDSPDAHNDVFTREAIAEAAARFSAGQGSVTTEGFTVTQSYVTDAAELHAGTRVPAGSWIIEADVYDPVLRKWIAQGHISGFGISGLNLS